MLRQIRLITPPSPPLCCAAVLVCALSASCRAPLPPRQDAEVDSRPAAPPASPPSPSVPALTWAAHYGNATPPPALTNRERAALEAIEARIGLGCRLDGTLVEGARRHARELLDSTSARTVGQMERLRFTLHQLGVYDYVIEPLTAPLRKDGPGALLDAWAHRSAHWTHCGLGIAETDTDAMAVWIGVRRVVRLAPIPIHPERPATIEVQGQIVESPNAAVRLFVGRPDRSAFEPKGRENTPPGQFAFDIALARSGKYELELLADTGHGLETVALFPVFVGVPPDERPTVTPSIPNPRDLPLSDALERFLDNARKKAGVPPLERDHRLDAIALAHSEDMAKRRFFGHVSPQGGGLKSRLKRANLSPARFAENIAKSNTVFRIHTNLMKSPSHRISMLSDRFTHVGIGVAADGGELIATQVYAAW